MYDYKTLRPEVFTDQGQRMFLKIRDHAQRLLKEAGAVRLSEMIRPCSGDGWQMLACVDRLVELGEIREVVQPDPVAHHRIFVAR